MDMQRFTPNREWRGHRCYATFVKGASENLGMEEVRDSLEAYSGRSKDGGMEWLNRFLDDAEEGI